jgi:hypothetical protein
VLVHTTHTVLSKKEKMKHTVVVLLIGYMLFSCRDGNTSRLKTEKEVYSKLKKRIDSFANEALPAFSITRIKKVAKRIEQIDTLEALILDTLADKRILAYKKIDGRSDFYLTDGTSIIQLHSQQVRPSLRADATAIELFETMKRRKCAEWIQYCNSPDFPLSPEDKLLCDLNISFYCK